MKRLFPKCFSGLEYLNTESFNIQYESCETNSWQEFNWIKFQSVENVYTPLTAKNEKAENKDGRKINDLKV